ncbi:MAG: hypothetical protein KC543_05135 [Myxococcales bacterium]|nr:hypothetical protein [Myxococcales bacterium]
MVGLLALALAGCGGGSSGGTDLCEGESCDDGVACTTDSCVPSSGNCVYIPDDHACAPSTDECRAPHCDATHGCSDVVVADGTLCSAGSCQDGGGRSTSIVAVAAGGFHSLTLEDDSTVWAWGDNSFGELGDGTHTGRDVPMQVTGL